MLSLLSGLRVYAAIGTWVAAGASIVLWLATGWGAAWSSAIGLLIGLVVLVIAGVTAQGATARSANRSRFHILRDWAQDLMATAKANPSTDCAAAASADPIQARLDVQRRLLETCKGPHWISGKGYVSVSRSLAEIEVSLLGRMTVSDLLDQARFDKMRLTGSSVENRDGLLALLNAAIDDLTAAMSQVGPTAKPPLVMAKSVNCPSAAEEVNRRMTVDPVKLMEAANVAKQARNALNDHRDSSREGLAHLRTRTLDAMALVGFLVYLLILVATVAGSRPLQFASAAGFFLVAALVGLIAALNSLSILTTADDDFGLASARLIASSILSGLAGVGGVGLVYLSGTAGALLGAASSPRTDLLLNDIFDVVNRPITLVVAAVFGATPTLLFTGLSKLGDRYATNLSSTHPSSTEKTGT